MIGKVCHTMKCDILAIAICLLYFYLSVKTKEHDSLQAILRLLSRAVYFFFAIFELEGILKILIFYCSYRFLSTTMRSF